MRDIFKFAFVFILISTSTLAQTNYKTKISTVLTKGDKNKEIVFGEWNENGDTELRIKYLGVIKSKNASYKVITSSWIWGQSKRATNKLLVYNLKNKYLGAYYLTERCDLPDHIENNKLIFYRSNCINCDKHFDKVSFKNGIPKEIFLRCTGKYGDLISFYISED